MIAASAMMCIMVAALHFPPTGHRTISAPIPPSLPASLRARPPTGAGQKKAPDVPGPEVRGELRQMSHQAPALRKRAAIGARAVETAASVG